MKSIRPLLALAFVTGAAAFQAPAAHAQTVNPIPAPTIITSAPYTISSPGYYQLGANLTVTATTGNIITIATGNVTLDFGGHYIAGPSNSTLYGVYAYEHGNITIQNGTIANCYEGINFYGNGQSTSQNYNQIVRNMLVTFCSHIGVNFQSTLYSTCTDNVISNIGGATAANGTGNYGVYGQGLYSTISNNTISTITSTSNAAYGIYVPGSFSAILTKNRIFDAQYGISLPNTASKYQDNLTSACTTSFTGGTDAGGNN